MATKTIGSASRDFATWASWVTYFNALDLTTGGPEFANPFLDNGTWFSVAGQVAHIANANINSSNFLTITPTPGNSFSDNPSVRTNALYYNAANGPGVNDTATGGSSIAFELVSTSFTVFSGLQMHTTDARVFIGTGNSLIFNRCIFVGGLLEVNGDNWTFNNCLFVTTLGSQYGMQSDVTTSCTFNYCTFICAPSLPYYINYAAATTTTFTNCAFFGGGTTAFHNGSPTSETFSHCMTDITGTTGLTGSKTFANQFVSTTNDFRTKTGADLIGAGTPVGGVTTDISGARRPATPTIGAWEFAPASAHGITTLGAGLLMPRVGLLPGALAYGAKRLIDNPRLSRRGFIKGWRP